MKQFILLATTLFVTSICFSQSVPSKLVGMYESNANTDWVSLRSNGTGKLSIRNDFMPLGSLTFVWEADDDQVIITFKDESGYETKKWFYWTQERGVIKLDLPTMGPFLSFLKTT